MNFNETALLAGLPGAELIAEGVADVVAGRETIAGELVKVGSPRLRSCGIDVPVTPEHALDADRRMHRLLGAAHGRDAHSRYNALIRQLVSFEQALERRVRRARMTATSPGAPGGNPPPP
ncbi:MAG: hypothetical protein EXS37_08990 [Opitutus sp.]|nr:hypothetical protein [Opitutus sp.]